MSFFMGLDYTVTRIRFVKKSPDPDRIRCVKKSPDPGRVGLVKNSPNSGRIGWGWQWIAKVGSRSVTHYPEVLRSYDSSEVR